MLTTRGVRGDADEARCRSRCAAGRAGVAAGDDAGHVRAVPEGVEVAQVRLLRLERQVRAVHDLVRRGEPSTGSDAGVDQRDVDALAGEARSSRTSWRRSVGRHWSCRRPRPWGRSPQSCRRSRLSLVTARDTGAHVPTGGQSCSSARRPPRSRATAGVATTRPPSPTAARPTSRTRSPLLSTISRTIGPGALRLRWSVRPRLSAVAGRGRERAAHPRRAPRRRSARQPIARSSRCGFTGPLPTDSTISCTIRYYSLPVMTVCRWSTTHAHLPYAANRTRRFGCCRLQAGDADARSSGAVRIRGRRV